VIPAVYSYFSRPYKKKVEEKPTHALQENVVPA
jgi:hypothetical protein